MLVLGSLPGAASIAAGQYYAHPRNLFWPFMGELFGAGPALPYAERVARLTAAGIAVWDVLASAPRHGSLDSAIALRAAVRNDIAGLLAREPGLRWVACNGQLAARVLARQAGTLPAGVHCEVLPSTSPANAGLPVAQRLERWRVLVRLAGRSGV
ncbi:MAG: hypothetical protein RL026_1245 [Pseudomonadota bacterium]